VPLGRFANGLTLYLSLCAEPPASPLVGQKWALKCVSRFCATLYSEGTNTDPTPSQTISVHFLITQSFTNDGNISFPPAMVSILLDILTKILYALRRPSRAARDSFTSLSSFIIPIIDADQAHKLLQTKQQQNLQPEAVIHRSHTC